jgi:hypothetical protein
MIFYITFLLELIFTVNLLYYVVFFCQIRMPKNLFGCSKYGDNVISIDVKNKFKIFFFMQMLIIIGDSDI